MPKEPLALDIDPCRFDEARDAFLIKLFDADAPKEASHPR